MFSSKKFTSKGIFMPGYIVKHQGSAFSSNILQTMAVL